LTVVETGTATGAKTVEAVASTSRSMADGKKLRCVTTPYIAAE